MCIKDNHWICSSPFVLLPFFDIWFMFQTWNIIKHCVETLPRRMVLYHNSGEKWETLKENMNSRSRVGSTPQRWQSLAPATPSSPFPLPPDQTRPGSASSSFPLTPQSHVGPSGSGASGTGWRSLTHCRQKQWKSAMPWERSRTERRPALSWSGHPPLRPCQ